MICGHVVYNYTYYVYMLSLPCLSALLRRFALYNLCDLFEHNQLGCLGGSVGRATALNKYTNKTFQTLFQYCAHVLTLTYMAKLPLIGGVLIGGVLIGGVVSK